MKLTWVAIVSLGLAAAAHAQLAAPRSNVDSGSPQSSALASQAAESLVRGRPSDALQVANNAVAADARNPWAHYNKAAALADLGRVDEALTEYRAAQAAFSASDPWGRSVAIYGRANALAQVGRCDEAKPAFEEYAAFVEPSDPRSAALARGYATGCVARTPR
jgi:tetratricopeptide (TPR) repeat protein